MRRQPGNEKNTWEEPISNSSKRCQLLVTKFGKKGSVCKAEKKKKKEKFCSKLEGQKRHFAPQPIIRVLRSLTDCPQKRKEEERKKREEEEELVGKPIESLLKNTLSQDQEARISFLSWRIGVQRLIKNWDFLICESSFKTLRYSSREGCPPILWRNSTGNARDMRIPPRVVMVLTDLLLCL